MGESEKIEVTPAMIEAGVMHLYAYDPEKGVDDEETVIRIYRAMCAASSCPEKPSS